MYSALLWQDSRKPSFFLMDFVLKKRGRSLRPEETPDTIDGKIVKKIDFVKSHVLIHYSKIKNLLIYVDALGFIHCITFRVKQDLRG